MVEVTLEKVYYGKLKFTIVNGAVTVTGILLARLSSRIKSKMLTTENNTLSH